MSPIRPNPKGDLRRLIFKIFGSLGDFLTLFTCISDHLTKLRITPYFSSSQIAHIRLSFRVVFADF